MIKKTSIMDSNIYKRMAEKSGRTIPPTGVIILAKTTESKSSLLIGINHFLQLNYNIKNYSENNAKLLFLKFLKTLKCKTEKTVDNIFIYMEGTKKLYGFRDFLITKTK